MRKYSTEFKLEVVQSFLARDGGAKLLARRWSLPEEKIRTWVSHYRLHGIDGLRPKRSAYSVQFKLQVLSHQDREQLSSRQVAAIYDIRNSNQVVVWRRHLVQGGVEALGTKIQGRHHASSRLWLAITDRDKFAIERLHPNIAKWRPKRAIQPTTLGSIFLRPSQQSRQASQQCDASNTACTCAKVITSAYFACKSKRLALCGAE
jgi:transposase-like protein